MKMIKNIKIINLNMYSSYIINPWFNFWTNLHLIIWQSLMYFDKSLMLLSLFGNNFLKVNSFGVDFMLDAFDIWHVVRLDNAKACYRNPIWPVSPFSTGSHTLLFLISNISNNHHPRDGSSWKLFESWAIQAFGSRVGSSNFGILLSSQSSQ